MKSINKNIIWVFLLGLTSLVFTSCGDDGTTVTATALSELVYTPNMLTADEGVPAESEVPTIKGSTPITFALTTTPDAGADIYINKNTGTISARATKPGTYMVTVTASNEVGIVEFKDVFTVNVTEKAKVTYNGNIRSIINQSCAPCHVYGGNETNFGSSYSATRSASIGIIDRIKRLQGSTGFMPYNGTKLDSATIAMFEQWKTDGLLEE